MVHWTIKGDQTACGLAMVPGDNATRESSAATCRLCQVEHDLIGVTQLEWAAAWLFGVLVIGLALLPWLF